MENTVIAAEVDPLKRAEDGGEVPSSAELKKKTCNGVLGFAKLTHWRTAVFFLSIFLCLAIVFAFSFIIPCPVRPQYLISWNRTFPEAASYDFLATEDTNRDKVNDILFVLRSSKGSQNNTCTGAGLPSPCVFFIAVDGTDGNALWECPLDPEFHWAQCGLEEDANRNWGCLVAHSDKLSAIDKYTGEVRWQQQQPPGLHGTAPVLSVPDLDRDMVKDLALVASDSTQTQLVFLSGKTGVLIGSKVVLNSTETANHLLHHSATGSQYVLLQTETGLYGLALYKIAAKAKPGTEVNLKMDKQWEKNASPTSGLIPIYESDSLRRVLRMGQGEGTPNLLLVTGKEVALLNGKTLQSLWKINSSSVLREPSFGHFNKDGILDVVVEEDEGDYEKRVVILDGKSGGVLWEVLFLATPNSPIPASIHTTNYFSIFVFWGKKDFNATSVPGISDRHIYMLHPLYSKVLLESPRSLDHILTFKATLLERGRHAAYILLTGPVTQEAQGTVVLSKRKLKQDVPNSEVCNVGDGAETIDVIKEAFNRLRFSD
ncbi:protein FAM234A [Takifugu rubripes]|uniref:Family with sequence similarity 234 member A n=1 Tax=Takifugu rubripes TaxID=31033 RepID=H2UXY0_TAKRU|nr:protein FAM234A [Takifugu rubripes]